MIWHNGRLWMYDGWAVKLDPYFGWMKLRPTRGFPGYVRLVDFATHEVEVIRADCVTVGSDPLS